MGKYILQVRGPYPWAYDQWKESQFGPFDTLEEAKTCLAARPFPNYYRIAEAYTVTRYRAVKL